MADANDETQAMPSQGEDDNRCDICLTDLSVGESEYLPCSHKFHLECLLDWAKHQKAHYLDLPCLRCRKTPSEVLAGDTQKMQDGQSRSTLYGADDTLHVIESPRLGDAHDVASSVSDTQVEVGGDTDVEPLQDDEDEVDEDEVDEEEDQADEEKENDDSEIPTEKGGEPPLAKNKKNPKKRPAAAEASRGRKWTDVPALIPADEAPPEEKAATQKRRRLNKKTETKDVAPAVADERKVQVAKPIKRDLSYFFSSALDGAVKREQADSGPKPATSAEPEPSTSPDKRTPAVPQPTKLAKPIAKKSAARKADGEPPMKKRKTEARGSAEKDNEEEEQAKADAAQEAAVERADGAFQEREIF